jgi:hypothetical protein
MIRQPIETRAKILAFFLLSPLLIGYLTFIPYRVSFKATALVYAPFVWAVQATTRSPMSIKLRLERIKKGALEKERRRFSWAVLFLAVVKIGLCLNLVDLESLRRR